MKTLGSTLLCAALVTLVGAAHASSSRAPTRVMERAHHLEAWMTMRSDRAQDWLGAARRKGKPERARCLSEKLSELHALERGARREVHAIELAVQHNGLTGTPMTRLRNMSERSKAVLDEAASCIEPRRARMRMRTAYRVRAHEPALPAIFD